MHSRKRCRTPYCSEVVNSEPQGAEHELCRLSLQVAHPVAALLLLATGQAPSAASTAARGGSLSQADGGGEGDGAAGSGSGWGGGTGRRVSVALGLLRNCPPPLQVQLVVEVLLPSAAALGGSSNRVAGGGSSTGDGGRGGAGRIEQRLLPPLLLPPLLRPADLHSDDLALPAIQVRPHRGPGARMHACIWFNAPCFHFPAA